MSQKQISHCMVSAALRPTVKLLEPGATYFIGRDGDCAIALDSSLVSRRHAELTWQVVDSAFAVRDLGSRNGTTVNGKRVDFQRLHDGDHVVIGPFSIRYRTYAGDLTEFVELPTNDESTVRLWRSQVGQVAGGGFGGTFAESDLLEICQLIGFNEKSGVLVVSQDEKELGTLSFCEGQIVSATYESRFGEQAARKLLMARGGKFTFSGQEVSQRLCQVDTQSLVMDVARERDEQKESEQS